MEIFMHRNTTGILKIIAKGQHCSSINERKLDIDMSRLENGLKVTVLTESASFFLTDTQKVNGSTISTPKSYVEHPRQVKYGSFPPPGLQVFLTSLEKKNRQKQNLQGKTSLVCVGFVVLALKMSDDL